MNVQRRLLHRQVSCRIVYYASENDNKSRLEILTQLRSMNEKKTNLLFSLNQLNIFCTKDGEGDKERIEEYCKNLKTKGIAAQKEIISKTAVDQRKKG
jgi:hypothetical protein